MTEPFRHLPFERAVNFRDLGGYPCADGRHTRWRLLFRSGHLARLTERDVHSFQELGVSHVYDFRSPTERTREPSYCIPSHLVRQLSISFQQNHDELVEQWKQRKITDEAVLQAQEQVYREIVIDHVDRYREMFDGILAGKGAPFVMHCSGGKDRTGIASVLLLSALGAGKDIIYLDYLETLQNRATVLWIKKLARDYLETGGSDGRDGVEERAFQLFGVTRERLTIALTAMSEVGGSIAGYLERYVRLTAKNIEQLRDWYLEQA